MSFFYLYAAASATNMQIYVQLCLHREAVFAWAADEEKRGEKATLQSLFDVVCVDKSEPLKGWVYGLQIVIYLPCSL